MQCQRCGERESTGVLIQLCDPCFDKWEAAVNRNPREVDIGPIDKNLVYKSAGGLVSDDVKAAKISGNEDGVIIEYQR